MALRNSARRSSLSAMLLQSSGTTGRPKIVRRLGPALDAVARNVAEAIGLTATDRVLAAIPLCHSYGVENALLAPILAGASIHLCDGFDSDVVARQLSHAAITVFPGVPFMFQVLAERAQDMSAPSLRRAYSAGGSLPRAVFERFQRRFGAKIGQLYGSTEVGSVTFNDPDFPDFDPANVGTPMGNVEIRVLDPDHPSVGTPLSQGADGHVAITSPSMLQVYIDEEIPALMDGFFLTGDLGRVDVKGRLTITGRIKLQIDVGGLKVNPLEIEHVLAEHPEIKECIVVPMPVTQTLDRLKAFITLENGRDSISFDDLRRFARARLAPHKIPRVFEIRPSLPKSPTGKILREALRCD